MSVSFGVAFAQVGLDDSRFVKESVLSNYREMKSNLLVWARFPNSFHTSSLTLDLISRWVETTSIIMRFLTHQWCDHDFLHDATWGFSPCFFCSRENMRRRKKMVTLSLNELTAGTWKWTHGGDSFWKASLGGGFKHFLCSPRTLGKMNPFWRAYFSNGLKPPTRSCSGSMLAFREGNSKCHLSDTTPGVVLHRWLS